ncbi:MAG: acyltransferase [Rhodocyclales bacterium]|nr:acyltransferase [Rhodocyclales bacterium]
MTRRFLSGVAEIYRVALSRPIVHRGELLCVQRLRGVAVFMVLLVHIEDVSHRLSGWEGFHSFFALNVGYSGPDMFFVISGFIMSYITFGAPFYHRRWLVSRFIRIYPLYMLFTGLVVLLWLHNPAMTMGSGAQDWGSVIRSMLIVPQAGLPLLFVGWTVEHEIVFYTLVFVVARFLSLNWLIWVLLGLSLLAFAKWVMVNSGGVDFWDYHFLSLYMAQFAMGALVYRYWEQTARLGWRLPLAAAAVLFALGVAYCESGAINMEQPLRVLTFGGAYSALLLGLLNREKQQRAIGCEPDKRDALVLIGDASYSLYLSHPFVLAAFGKAFVYFDPPAWSALPWLMVAAVTTLVVGYLVHVFLERPLIEVGKRMSRWVGRTATLGVGDGCKKSGTA